jgi:hypothetical protein
MCAMLAATSVNASAFAVSCYELEVDVGKRVPVNERITWDGTTWTTIGKDALTGKEERFDERVISSKEMASSHPLGKKYAIFSSTHPTRLYRYYTTVDISPDGYNHRVDVVNSTMDSDGFLVAASAWTYRSCKLK